MANKQEINKLMQDMQKKFGETAVVWATDIPVGPPVSSGSLALDFAMGYGGFPQNRVVEICGKEGTGKTTLALLTMLNALEANPHRIAIFLDVEHKITKDWLEMLVGKELLGTRVWYMQPTSIEQATNMYRQAVDSGIVCCAILDSIGGAPTVRRNDDAEVGHYGGNAIGVGEFARAAAALSSAHDCLTIGINQTREDMSGYHALNTPGGSAWKHACVMRVQLKRGKGELNDKVDGETVPVGYTVSAKVVKNQVGAPYRVATWWFCNVQTARYGFGVDTVDETIRLSNLVGVVENKGGWYYHQGLPGGKINGMAKLIDAIKANPKLQKEIAKETMLRLKDHASEVAPIVEKDLETFEEKHSILNRPDQAKALFDDDPTKWSNDQMGDATTRLLEKFAGEG